MDIESVLAAAEETQDSLQLSTERSTLFFDAAKEFSRLGDVENTRHCWAESIVFGAHEEESTNSRTFLHPQVVMNGVAFNHPEAVPDVLIPYFEQRLVDAQNPYLRARYADFLWQRGASHTAARAGIAAHLDVASRETESERFYNAVDSVRRALALAHSLNDADLVKSVHETVEKIGSEWAQLGGDGAFFVHEIVDKILTWSALGQAAVQIWENVVRNALDSAKEYRTRRELLEVLARLLDKRKQPNEAKEVRRQVGDEWFAEAEERRPNSALVAAVFYGHAFEALSRVKKVRQLVG